MRLALHIFRKDARLLWWEAAVSLGLLAALANLDCYRADKFPGPIEGLFNLLLPLAWCYVIALLIQEEPLVGDSQFWVTRPYSWAALLAAKSLFVVLFIHLPLALADVSILLAHEFKPFGYLQELALKQVKFACVLTLPAAALAAVTKGVPQFILSAIVISGAGIFITESTTVFSRPWVPVDSTRLGIAYLTSAATGLAILIVQYARRRTALSRSLAVGAALAAGASFLYLPREYTVAAACGFSPAAFDARRVSVSLTPGKYPRQGDRYRGGNLELVQIPVTVSGLEAADEIMWEQLKFEISGARGGRWQMQFTPQRQAVNSGRVWATLATQGANSGWLMLSLDPSVYGRIMEEKVTVSGRASATPLRKTAPTQLRIGRPSAAVSGAGRCFAVEVNDSPPRGFTREALKVVCESPAEIPLLSRVRLVRSDGGRDWIQRLDDAMPYFSYPTQAWLSPINRRQTLFHIIDENRTDEGSRWLVPRQFLPNSVVEVAPAQPAGCVVVDYELRDLALGEYRVK